MRFNIRMSNHGDTGRSEGMAQFIDRMRGALSRRERSPRLERKEVQKGGLRVGLPSESR